MKKLTTCLFLLALLVASCGGKKEKTAQSETPVIETPETKPTEEATTLESAVDSVVMQLEASKTEIEESAKKLDNLLNDIQ